MSVLPSLSPRWDVFKYLSRRNMSVSGVTLPKWCALVRQYSRFILSISCLFAGCLRCGRRSCLSIKQWSLCPMFGTSPCLRHFPCPAKRLIIWVKCSLLKSREGLLMSIPSLFPLSDQKSHLSVHKLDSETFMTVLVFPCVIQHHLRVQSKGSLHIAHVLSTKYLRYKYNVCTRLLLILSNWNNHFSNCIIFLKFFLQMSRLQRIKQPLFIAV
jgi:hypothetical protein